MVMVVPELAAINIKISTKGALRKVVIKVGAMHMGMEMAVEGDMGEVDLNGIFNKPPINTDLVHPIRRDCPIHSRFLDYPVRLICLIIDINREDRDQLLLHLIYLRPHLISRTRNISINTINRPRYINNNNSTNNKLSKHLHIDITNPSHQD